LPLHVALRMHNPVMPEANARGSEILSSARRRGRRFKQAVQLPLIVSGITLIALGVFVPSGLAVASSGALRASHAYAGFLCVFPATFVLLIAILPTDKKLIGHAARALLAFGSLSVAVTAQIANASLVAALSGDARTCLEATDEDGSERAAQGSGPCTMAMAYAVSSLAFTIPVCAWFIVTGTRDFVTRLKRREMLVRIQKRTAILYAALGINFAMRTLAGAVLGLIHPSAYWVLTSLMAAETLVLGALLQYTPFRSAVHAWMARRSHTFASAAAMAALIGQQPPHVVEALAVTTFRAVPANLLTLDALRSHSPDANGAHLSVPATLGAVDAFVSHAWDDDADGKWEQLQAWRADFVARQHREPMLWIDKYCISTEDLATNLACLPAYVAGCNSMLVLAGPTYLTRLWCLLEILTFMGMLTDVENIDLRLFGGITTADLESISLESAGCSDQAAAEQMRDCISAGFLSMSSCDDKIRDLLIHAAQRVAVKRTRSSISPSPASTLRASYRGAGTGVSCAGDQGSSPPESTASNSRGGTPGAQRRSFAMPTIGPKKVPWRVVPVRVTREATI